jgi:hypothetical protein
MNFEDWDDYVPVNDLVEKPKKINNNIIELKKDDNIDFSTRNRSSRSYFRISTRTN